jgi:hypothetical protein
MLYEVFEQLSDANSSQTPDGVIPRMQDVLHSSNPLWPGTTAPLKKTFTRIPFIDQMLYNLNPFFAHVADGTDPALSVYFLFFIGQYGAAIGLSWLESYRVGNRGRVISLYDPAPSKPKGTQEHSILC